MRYPIVSAILLALAVPTVAMAAAPADQARDADEVHDLACFQGLAATREAMLKEPGRAAEADSILPAISFYAGKIAPRHPLKSIWDIASGEQVRIGAMLNDMNPNTCIGEYQIAMGLVKP